MIPDGAGERNAGPMGPLSGSASKPRRSRAFQALGAAFAGAILALGLWGFGVLDSWEWRTWDWRARLLAEKGPATDDIVMILLDGASLEWGRRENGWSWPWPREVYAAIVDHCRRQGAKAVALDILFTEPSVYGVADDESLGRAITAAANVALAMFPSPKEDPETGVSGAGGGTSPALRFTPPVPEVAPARPCYAMFTWNPTRTAYTGGFRFHFPWNRIPRRVSRRGSGASVIRENPSR